MYAFFSSHFSISLYAIIKVENIIILSTFPIHTSNFLSSLPNTTLVTTLNQPHGVAMLV
jgi:hypothetical protein